MARLVAIEHLTLDGVMQGPARPDEDTRDGFVYGGWSAAGNDPLMQQVIGEQMGAGWALLAGRTTYQDFAKVWPARKPNPMAEALDRVEKFVVSRTLTEPLPWQNSVLLTGDAADAVAQLKREHQRTLIVFGSGVLLQSLMPHNLIDTYVLQIHPIVLGTGRRFFPAGTALDKLDLIDSKHTKTGVIITTYQPKQSGQ
ncbi:MAG TPA: dihydrofolate reductase family protein [Gemmatimonadaceae bacterium]|jgi:dihydrofolate reductase